MSLPLLTVLDLRGFTAEEVVGSSAKCISDGLEGVGWGDAPAFVAVEALTIYARARGEFGLCEAALLSGMSDALGDKFQRITK